MLAAPVRFGGSWSMPLSQERVEMTMIEDAQANSYVLQAPHVGALMHDGV